MTKYGIITRGQIHANREKILGETLKFKLKFKAFFQKIVENERSIVERIQKNILTMIKNLI